MTIKTLQKYDGRILDHFPTIEFPSLFKSLVNSFYFEFLIADNKYLFAPFYSQVRGEKSSELLDFISKNEKFLDSLKTYIITSLFIYSAIIEENSYYLMKPESILISRMIYKNESNFEMKYYTHYEDELLNSYNDKIYIGRNFINLEEFIPKHLGLTDIFHSLLEQNQKIQERAKHKLRYFQDYKKPYLDEIEYLIKETVTEAESRIELFPEKNFTGIPKIKTNEILESLLYVQNLMIELRDFTQEFENKLRIREENSFVKYLTKFSKDLITDIRYLRKLCSQIHLKISNYSIF